MPPARTSFELLVGRHVSAASLATFPVALVPTTVPRQTVHRLRVGADSDIAEIVRRLTERDVALLEIRRCPERRWERPAERADAPALAEDPDTGGTGGTGGTAGTGGVVVPFPAASGRRPRPRRRRG